MRIMHSVETKTDNYPEQKITIKCSYPEFLTLCEMIEANVPDGDLETELLSEFEVAQDAFKAAQ